MTGRKKTRRAAPDPGSSVLHDFHLMAKPAGPRCNLRCVYCFYREKEVLFEKDSSFLMSDSVLDAYTREHIRSQTGPCVSFDWQGGEPSLRGLDFFEKALALQKKYGGGKEILNTFQTNGILLDEAWLSFLARNRFLVGLSMDGPPDIHDACRMDKAGVPTGERVLLILKSMQQHGVEVNVLATVNSENSKHPLEVYRFFREHGARFIQFIPVIEREADADAEELGLKLSGPPSLRRPETSVGVTPWSVRSERYGEFFIRIFDEWFRHDVGKVFVMNFEWSLAAWAGAGPGVCYLAPRCGMNLIMEHNGDIYSCDHFMYPPYRIGNILGGGLRKMVDSMRQREFGAMKETALPEYCRRCEFLFACRGGCPKHRLLTTPDGEPGLNYLCAGFRAYYRHIDHAMKKMVRMLCHR